MPETDYPQIVKHEDFGLVKPILKPAPASSTPSQQNANSGVSGKQGSGGSTTTVVRPPETAVAGIQAVAFLVANKTSLSYHNGLSMAKDQYIKPDATRQVNFAPTVDSPLVAWKLSLPEKISKVTFELICKSRAKPGFITIATTTWDSKILKDATKNAPSQDWSGALALDKLFTIPKKFKIDDNDDAFPDGCLTAANSPYQLRMTITPDMSATPTAFPLVAWTYIHVLVHSIQLKVGRADMLVQERPDVEGNPNKTKVLAAEAAIINKLAQATQPFDPNAGHEIELESNLFRSEAARLEAESDIDFQEYKKLWGNGPRIPLIATVLLKKADGTATDQAPQALGRTKLLWDWEDTAPDRWKQELPKGVTAKTTQFLEKLFKPGKLPVLPEGSNNCPVAYGGKYGQNADPVFPPQTVTNIFPNRVEAATNRGWAAFSSFGAGPAAATTAVIFQPSRMAGDRYTVRVYLDINRERNLNTASKLEAHPTLQAKTGSFLILRKVRLLHLVRGATRLGADPTELENYIKNFYRKELFLSVDVRRSTVDNTIYQQATTNAIDMFCREYKLHGSMIYLPFIARNMVKPDPVDGSPGVVLRDRDDFLTRVEGVFRSGVIRRLTLTQTNPEVIRDTPHEELVGTSGARGIILSGSSTVPSSVLFYNPNALFGTNEVVTGYASGKIYNQTMGTTPSCWGRSIVRTYATTARYNTTIDVTFQSGNTTSTVTVAYPRTRMGGSLTTEVSDAARRTLRQSLVTLGQTIDETRPVAITLKGNKTIANSFKRFNLLESCLEELFGEAIVDRKAYWERMSSYGHTLKPVSKTAQDENGRYREAIVVAFPNGSTCELTYAKSSTKTLLTELSDAVLQDLRLALQSALTAFQNVAEKTFDIEIRARTNSVNATNRVENLKAYLKQLFNEYAITDARAVWQQHRLEGNSPAWIVAKGQGQLRICKKDLPISGILPSVITEYSRLALGNEEGIAVLHIPGRSNLADLSVGTTYKELKITGAFYSDIGRRQLGVVYCSSVNPNQTATDPTPTKTVPTIFVHELAHALYLPHAYQYSPGEVPGREASAIAHLSQDNCLMNYDLDSEHFCAICMLRIRGWNWKLLPNVGTDLEYKVTLEIDDPSTLFPFPANHPEGLKARLQVLGLFNRPLRHEESDACLEFSWRHFVDLFPEVAAGGVELEDFFNQEIKKFLVERGTLPTRNEFAKIRIPNNYHIIYPMGILELIQKTYGFSDEQMKPYELYGLTSNRYKVEQKYHDENIALGKIPLKAKVVARPKNTQLAFQPVPGATIYFELMNPDALPAYKEDTNPEAARQPVAGGYSYYKQVTAPTLRGSKGPADYIKARVTDYDVSSGNDPQVNNTHAHLGGRRKLGNVSKLIQFSTGVFRENIFSTPLSVQDFEDLAPLKNVPDSLDAKFPYSVRVDADEDGVARVVFNPSRIGGDSYRLRASLIKFSVYTGDVVASAETGTMVRWRTIRISRYLTMPVPRTMEEMPAELQTLANLTCPHDSRNGGMVCLPCQMSVPKTQYPAPLNAPCLKHGTQQGNICYSCFLEKFQLPEIDFKGTITREYAKAYSELILEPRAVAPEPISAYAEEILQGAQEYEQRYPLINSTNLTKTYITDRFQQDGNKKTQFTVKFKCDNFDITSFRINRFFTRPKATTITWEKILTTNPVQLIDNNRVAEGVKGTINYDTGELSVTFTEAQKVDAVYEAYYGSGVQVDLNRNSSTLFTATLDLQFEPGSISVQPKQANVTAPDANSIILHDSWGAMSPTNECPEGVRGTIDYANKIVTVTMANALADGEYYELAYHASGFVDLTSLLYFPERSPFLFNFYLPPTYNSTIGETTQPMQVDNTFTPGYFKPPVYGSVVDSDFGTVKNWLFQAVSYGLNHSHGFYPGLIFVLSNYVNNYNRIWETKALDGKGPGNIVYVFANQLAAKNPYTTLALHEMSHTLYMVHAPLVQNAIPERHDTGDSVRCLMSYDPNEGDFCGQCLAILRGMNGQDLRFVTVKDNKFGAGVPANATSLPVTG